MTLWLSPVFMQVSRSRAKILVVLIGLVIIFQTNIKSVVSTIFSTIETNAGKIR